MGDDVIIQVEGVAKKFCRQLRRSMYYGAVDILRSAAGVSPRSCTLRRDEFWAVQDVSFLLRRGETLGLIGANGSGKSTLLRLLNGIYEPDIGRIELRGTVGALIALGAGFHPLMTGRENIYLNGTILGMSKKQIDDRFDDIVDFADIGEFLEAPVKTYSSGMHVRLGFAIAIQAEPDVLLVDELLAVGDASFQKKCFEKILAMVNRGTSVILVSHSVSTIERLCTRGLLLEAGRQSFLGSARECVQKYFYEIGQQNVLRGSNQRTIGVGEVILSNVRVYQKGGDRDNPNVEFGSDIVIEFDYEFTKKASDRNQVRVLIRTYEGHDVQRLFFHEAPFPDEHIYPNEKVLHLKEKGLVRIVLLRPRFFPQTFRLDVAVSRVDMDVHLGGIANAALFNIVHPTQHRSYFEYGNTSVTEFECHVEVL